MAAIELEWDGKTYTIAENEVFEVGELVEDIVTLVDLEAMVTSPKFYKLSRCFAVMLKHAGASVTADQIHKRIMAEMKAAGESAQAEFLAGSIASLSAILMNGAPDIEANGDDAKKKKA